MDLRKSATIKLAGLTKSIKPPNIWRQIFIFSIFSYSRDIVTIWEKRVGIFVARRH